MKFRHLRLTKVLILQISILAALAATSTAAIVFWNKENQVGMTLSAAKRDLDKSNNELGVLKSEDQYVKNKNLEEEINNIVKNYKVGVDQYEEILRLRENKTDTKKLDEMFAQSLLFLSKRNYASAGAVLKDLQAEIERVNETNKTTALAEIPKNAPFNNSPPQSGYSRQTVEADAGKFMVDIISADLNSTRVIVDTAGNETCSTDCPVDSLAAYAGRNGAFAGVNGPYFCPAEYPTCADRKNSFDTLLMNKNKVYFNSDNNVYSSVPAVIFSGSGARFVGQSLEWGRDTGADSVIAAQPMLLSGGNIAFGGDGDPKKGSRGNRSFIGTNGSSVYIGVVHNATVSEVAHVLKAMGIQNALNLDSGGSTALWYQGKYIAGPGRNTPFGILLVSK